MDFKSSSKLGVGLLLICFTNNQIKIKPPIDKMECE